MHCDCASKQQAQGLNAGLKGQQLEFIITARAAFQLRIIQYPQCGSQRRHSDQSIITNPLAGRESSITDSCSLGRIMDTSQCFIMHYNAL
jgi:hypothetical protein